MQTIPFYKHISMVVLYNTTLKSIYLTISLIQVNFPIVSSTVYSKISFNYFIHITFFVKYACLTNNTFSISIPAIKLRSPYLIIPLTQTYPVT